MEKLLAVSELGVRGQDRIRERGDRAPCGGSEFAHGIREKPEIVIDDGLPGKGVHHSERTYLHRLGFLKAL